MAVAGGGKALESSKARLAADTAVALNNSPPQVQRTSSGSKMEHIGGSTGSLSGLGAGPAVGASKRKGAAQHHHHGHHGAGGGVGSCFPRHTRGWRACLMLTSCLGLAMLMNMSAGPEPASTGSIAGYDLERAGGLPSDLLHEELDDWDHIATRGLRHAEGGTGRSGQPGGGEEEGAGKKEKGSEGATEAEEGRSRGRSAAQDEQARADTEQFMATIKKSFPERRKRSIIKIAEDKECSLPRPLKPCRLHPSKRIHIVFVSAMWNREANTKRETEHMLKSILYGTKCPLHIHFLVSGEPEVSTIHAMMASIHAANIVPVPAPGITGHDLSSLSALEQTGYLNDTADKALRARLLYSQHFIPADWVLRQAKNLEMYPLDHHAGIPGMSKFFMPEILWQVQRALYLDVDMLLAGDIQDLHGYFKEMEKDPELLYYMSNNHPEGHNKRRWLRPYCSCQLVLHLERMRKANMSKLFLSTLRGHKPRDLQEYVSDGDQFLFMRTCKVLHRVCRILPRMWNVSGCSKPIPFLGLSARGREQNGSCWRVVHFNCMGHKGKRKGRYDVPGEWEEAYRWTSSLTLPEAARNHMKTEL